MGKLISEFSSNQPQDYLTEPPSAICQTSSDWWICLEVTKTIKWKPCICEHLFWYTCLKDWWNVTNAWPLCKITFKFIVKLKEDGSEESREEVMDKKPVVDQIYFNAVDERWYIWDRDDNEGQLLICDNWDARVCHTYWDNLDVVPESEWFWSHWRAGERDYNILANFLENEFDIIEGQPSTIELEEEKFYDSENDDEYDPNYDTIHSPWIEKDEKKYQPNSKKTFDDDFDYNEFSDNSNSMGYESTYYMRSGIATRLTRSSMRYSKPRRNKFSRSNDREVHLPSKRLTKKREVKFRIK